MLTRRDLITTGAVLSPLPRGVEAAAQTGQRSADDSVALREMTRAIAGLRERPGSGYIAQLRERQRTFFRQYQRFPDYVDVGIRVWESLHDWHVDTGQEMKMSRSPDGRYQLEFMTSQIVLRHELADTEIGLAYSR